MVTHIVLFPLNISFWMGLLSDHRKVMWNIHQKRAFQRQLPGRNHPYASKLRISSAAIPICDGTLSKIISTCNILRLWIVNSRISRKKIPFATTSPQFGAPGHAIAQARAGTPGGAKSRLQDRTNSGDLSSEERGFRQRPWWIWKKSAGWMESKPWNSEAIHTEHHQERMDLSANSRIAMQHGGRFNEPQNINHEDSRSKGMEIDPPWTSWAIGIFTSAARAECYNRRICVFFPKGSYAR